MINLGLYGKLPNYGDFVHRNLPAKFITTWDEWLQQFVSGSQEQMGEQWLDIYLTSPIWRFVLSAGIIDEYHWAGIVLPSVDQVGRYYPFTIAIPLPGNINPCEFMSANRLWFEELENLALQALDGQLDLEALVSMTEHQKYLQSVMYRKTGAQLQTHNACLQIDLNSVDAQPETGYPHLFDSLLSSNMASYSLWSTSGSENISPCLVSTRGLPSTAQLPAMLDGQWAHWGWTQPYTGK